MIETVHFDHFDTQAGYAFQRYVKCQLAFVIVADMDDLFPLSIYFCQQTKLLDRFRLRPSYHSVLVRALVRQRQVAMQSRVEHHCDAADVDRLIPLQFHPRRFIRRLRHPAVCTGLG